MNIGKGIRVIRAARNLSQKQLAEVSGLDSSYISLVEAGKRAPKDEAIQAIAKALRVPKYLLLLLSSDKEDLSGISTEQADVLAKQLLEIILESEEDLQTTGK
jgi:transcriptional regulator with XRE-family HTH domain